MNVFVRPYPKTGIPYVISIRRWLCLYLLLSWLKEQHLVLWQVVTFYHFGDFIKLRRWLIFFGEVVYRCKMSEVTVMRLWGVVLLLSSTNFSSRRDHLDKRTHYVLDWNLWPHESYRNIHSWNYTWLSKNNKNYPFVSLDLKIECFELYRWDSWFLSIRDAFRAIAFATMLSNFANANWWTLLPEPVIYIS